MTRFLALSAALLFLVSCASTPPNQPVGTAPPYSDPTIDTSPSAIARPMPANTPAEFRDIPRWGNAELNPAMQAFKRSCAKLARKAADAPLSTRAPWAGTVNDWQPACAALDVSTNEASARTVFEALFVPVEIASPDGKTKFTGYFEPTYEARRTPIHPYTEPVPARPADLIPNGGKPLQRLRNGKTRPYPPRADITARGVQAIAYAHPSDVFFLQIQGSGRLIFPDGSTMRASYAAHNGQPFKSTANWLIKNGKISRGQASMQGIRAWMDRAGPAESRRAMNHNPRFVFFEAAPLGDPNLGPNGAQGVPLTPLGSVAVDPSIHPLGIPMFVNTTAPGLGGEWGGLVISQDTGGAIKGPVRGDLYFGTGSQAGERAGTMNAAGRLWVLLPRRVAERLQSNGLVAENGSRPSAP